MLAATTATILALSAIVSAAPTAIPITKYPGMVKADSYTIKLKDGVSKTSHTARLLPRFRAKYCLLHVCSMYRLAVR
ncbi:hypothetical protein FRC08_010712 [Ceratobasidium sp. 394]|nr:hypothetical protein FRC08_010712 [Ceratobasidium sp. 394]